MQPQHSEEEERELGLPDSDIDHIVVLPWLYDVDTPFTISSTRQGMTTIHSIDNPATSYAHN